MKDDPPGDAPRAYHHGDLRAALVAAALDLLEAEGLEGLSLRAIAARAGVSHAAPRRHFASLRALLTAVAAEGFWRHAAATRGDTGPDTPPAERFRVAVEGYAAFAAAHPALYALMFSPLHVDFHDPELGQAAQASYAVLSDIAAGLDWPGAEGPDRQARSEAMVFAFLHGYVTLRASGLLHGPGGLRTPAIGEVMPRFPHRPLPPGGEEG